MLLVSAALLMLGLVRTQRSHAERQFYEGSPPATTATGFRVSGSLRHHGETPHGLQAEPELDMQVSWYSENIARVQIQDQAALRWRPERAVPDLVQLPAMQRPRTPQW